MQPVVRLRSYTSILDQLDSSYDSAHDDPPMDEMEFPSEMETDHSMAADSGATSTNHRTPPESAKLKFARTVKTLKLPRLQKKSENELNAADKREQQQRALNSFVHKSTDMASEENTDENGTIYIDDQHFPNLAELDIGSVTCIRNDCSHNSHHGISIHFRKDASI